MTAVRRAAGVSAVGAVGLMAAAVLLSGPRPGVAGAGASATPPSTSAAIGANPGARSPSPTPGWDRRASGDGWRLLLPDDPELRGSTFGTMHLWYAGDADHLRGVVAGRIDNAPDGLSLEEVAARVRAELQMIPGGADASPWTRATLPAGEAVTMRRTIGQATFIAWGLLLANHPVRLIVAGYDDATAAQVAASLAADGR